MIIFYTTTRVHFRKISNTYMCCLLYFFGLHGSIACLSMLRRGDLAKAWASVSKLRGCGTRCCDDTMSDIRNISPKETIQSTLLLRYFLLKYSQYLLVLPMCIPRVGPKHEHMLDEGKLHWQKVFAQALEYLCCTLFL